MSDFAFKGVEELDAFFKTLPESMERRYIRQGFTAVGREMIRLAKQNLAGHGIRSRGRTLKANKSKDGILNLTTGLFKSITQRPSRQWQSNNELARKGIIGVAVGPKWPDGAHGYLVEFGHDVYSHGQKTDFRTTPQPFMRPAAIATGPKMSSILTLKFREGLQKEAAKARSQR